MKNVTLYWLQMLYAFHQWENFENRLTFDKVRADYRPILKGLLFSDSPGTFTFTTLREESLNIQLIVFVWCKPFFRYLYLEDLKHFGAVHQCDGHSDTDGRTVYDDNIGVYGVRSTTLREKGMPVLFLATTIDRRTPMLVASQGRR